MKVCILYDVEGWAHYHRAVALRKYVPEDIEITIDRSSSRLPFQSEFDIIVQLAYGACEQTAKRLREAGKRSILIAGYNVGWGYRGEYFGRLHKAADFVLFNNRENWERHNRPKRTGWISNGVDLDTFRITTPLAERTPKVLWCGSEFHRKNHDVKGYDSILLPLKAKLDAVSIAHDFRLVNSVGPAKASAKEMAAWYNTGTIYVVASAHEGTPNPALEAVACGCVPVSTRVGNMQELIEPYVNGELVERDVESVFQAVKRCQARYQEIAEAMQPRIAKWNWRLRANEYYALFRRLIGQRQLAVA